MGDEERVRREDHGPTEAPLTRLVVCIVIFGAWSVAVSAVHAIWPQRFDLTSVVVAEIAIAPVLIFLFHNIEAAYGDWKLAMRPYKVRNAFAKVDSLSVQQEDVVLKGRIGQSDVAGVAKVSDTAIVLEASERAQSGPTVNLDTAPDDIVFIRLRREIEKRLRAVALAYGIKDARFHFSPTKLLDELTRRKILEAEQARGLKELIAAGSAQAHGLATAPGIAEFARDEGDRLLAALDSLALKPEVALMNAVLEKAGVLDEPLEYQRYGVDLALPGRVAFEVKAGAQDKLNQSVALAKLRRLVENKSVKAGILILSDKPEGVEDGQDQKSDFELGFAWSKGDGFAGDALSRKAAPWLFQ